MIASSDRRCLLPAAAFLDWSEAPEPATGKKRVVWFDVNDVDLFASIGI